MKILFVAPWVPGPVRPRSAVLARLAAEQHDLRILTLARHDREAAAAEKLAGIGEVVVVKNPKMASLARVARGVFSPNPLQTAYANVGAFSRALRHELASFQPDLVHLNVLRTAHLLPALRSVPVLCDLDELRSRYFGQLAHQGGSAIWRLGARVEGPRAAALEQQVLESHAVVAVSSPEDSGPATGAVLVRTPLDVPYWSTAYGERPKGPPTVLFVGRLHYQANVDAITWFMDHCFATLRRRHAGLRLLIVGEAPPKAIRDRASGSVEVVADVEDLRPYYAQSHVALVPVHTGTGIQMKLIQAMASGTPAVVNQAAAERALVRGGVECLTAQSAEDWISAVDAVLSNPQLGRAIAAAGLEFVAAHHGLAAVRAQLSGAYSAALDATCSPSVALTS